MDTNGANNPVKIESRHFKSQTLWTLTALLLLAVLVIWRPDFFSVLFFAPGMVGLGMMASLPTRVADRISYSIDPAGGPASAIPLVGVVSVIFWAGLMLAWWSYRRHKRSH